MRVIIIGAGPTGLGAAFQLERNSHKNWLLLEGSSQVGGLSTSFTDTKGFVWDLGGHVEFSHYELFDHIFKETLGAQGFLTHTRNSWVLVDKTWIPYPVQNNLHRLNPKDRWKCIQSLLEPETLDSECSTYESWVISNLGRGFYEVFMKDYTLKVWSYPASMMNSQWVGERVAKPDLSTVLKSICLEEDYATWGPNREFNYPLRGGMGGFWKQFFHKYLLPKQLLLNERVHQIDVSNKVVSTETGKSFAYDVLISSIPLPNLIKLTNSAFKKELLQEVQSKVLWNQVEVIGLGFTQNMPYFLQDKTWLYFPNGDSPYFRVTVFKNYSPYNCPENCWSLIVECSSSDFKPLVNSDSLSDKVVTSLCKDGLIRPEDKPCSVFHKSLPFGYPVPFLGRDELIHKLNQTLEESQIYSRGRFGFWKYEVSNQDHSFMQGVEVVERILNDRLEITINHPSRVNSKSMKMPYPYPEW